MLRLKDKAYVIIFFLMYAIILGYILSWIILTNPIILVAFFALGLLLFIQQRHVNLRVLTRREYITALVGAGTATVGVALSFSGEASIEKFYPLLVYVAAAAFLTAFTFLTLLAEKFKELDEREKKAEKDEERARTLRRSTFSVLMSILNLSVLALAQNLSNIRRSRFQHSQSQFRSGDDELLEEIVNVLLNIYRATFYYDVTEDEDFYKNLIENEGYSFLKQQNKDCTQLRQRLKLGIPLGASLIPQGTQSGNRTHEVDLEPETAALLLHPLVRRGIAVRQLPLVDKIYAGATHNRFEHLIGVAALAGKTTEKLYDEIIKEIKNMSEKEPIRNDFIGYVEKNDGMGKERLKVLAEFAAILHDALHFGLGHSVDGVAPYALGKCINEESRIVDAPDNIAVRHFLSPQCGDSDLARHVEWSLTICHLFTKEESKSIVRDLFGKFFYETVPSNASLASLAYLLRSLVIGISNRSDSLDLDRIDYLTRDFLHTGSFIFAQQQQSPIQIIQDIDELVQKILSNDKQALNGLIEVQREDQQNCSDCRSMIYFVIKKQGIISARNTLRTLMYQHVYSNCHKLLMDAIATRLVFESVKTLHERVAKEWLKSDDARRAIIALLYAPTEAVLPLTRLILEVGYRGEEEKKELLLTLYDLLASYELYFDVKNVSCISDNIQVKINGKILNINKKSFEWLLNKHKFSNVLPQITAAQEDIERLQEYEDEILNSLKSGGNSSILVNNLSYLLHSFNVALRNPNIFEEFERHLCLNKDCIVLINYNLLKREVYERILRDQENVVADLIKTLREKPAVFLVSFSTISQ
jgi:HD superfamily phosphohydrolase